MICHFIDGEFRPARSGRTFDDINPVNGELIDTVSEGGKEDVDAAVAAARAALEGPWSRLTLAPRCDLLYTVAAEIERRADQFVDAEVADTGKPRSLAAHLDIPRGAANFRVFADVVRNVPTECFTGFAPDG